MENINKEVPVVTVIIEGKRYDVYTPHIKGHELKSLAGIALDEELLVSISGPYDDELIENEKLVEISRPEIEYFYKKRTLKFTINGHPHSWAKQYITGEEIRKLGKIDPEQELFLTIAKPFENERVQNDARIDLARPGVEHFISKAPNKDFIIIVNGREKPWNEEQINFQQVVTLAFGAFDNSANRVYTVTFSRGKDPKPEGTMVNGTVVPVKNKMIFNVTATDKS